MTTQLSESTQKKIDIWVKKFPEGQAKSAVISALMIVQDENNGYLTDERMKAVANYLKMPYPEVKEVASFYSMYEFEPVGQFKIKVCTNISCMLRGSETMVAHLEKKLNIKIAEQTCKRCK